MDKCYRCGNEPFLSKYYEEIDGEERMVCGKCRDIVCSICGKTKFKDNVARWTHTIDKETGEMLNFGDCCVFVEGKVDPIKAGIAKYNNLKHKSPEVIERMNQESQRKNAQRQSMLGDSAFTGNLIDNWARSKQKNKIITGK